MNQDQITDYATIYKEVRELLSAKERWLKAGVYAHTQDGKDVLGSDPRACKFCFVGAIQHVAGSVERERYIFDHLCTDIIDEPNPKYFLGDYGVTIWNDKIATHEDLMEFLDFLIDYYTKYPMFLPTS